MFPNRAPVSLLFLGFCSLSLPGIAQAQSCNPAMPVVTVVTPPGTVEYTDAYDVAYASGNKYELEKTLPNGAVLRGLAQTPIAASFSHQGRGQFQCYEPMAVEVVVGFSGPLKVAIDARYFQNSCNYQAIREHEDQHVAIARTAILNHAAGIRAAVEGAVAQALPYLRNTPNASQAFGEVVKTALSQSMQPVYAELRARNAELDSPDSYRRTQDLCPTW